MQTITIPSEKILEEISDNIIESVEEGTAAVGLKVRVKKITWTSKGLELEIDDSSK